MIRMTFLANGTPVVIEGQMGDNLMRAARLANVAIDAPCSGNGGCGKCRVRLISGALDSPRTRHISEAEYAEGWRLACLSRAMGDVVVEVPDIASAYRSRMKIAGLSDPRERAGFQRARLEMEAAGLSMDSGLSAVSLSMEAPTLEDTLPDTERAALAIQAETGAARVRFGFRALQKLARTLREGGFEARFVLEAREVGVQVLDVLPAGTAAPVAGLAVDLGTTSIAALLVDLESGEILARGSAGNGQIRYGADVINRIIEAGRPGGAARLQQAVIGESLIPLIQRLCGAAGIAPENVYRACVAGNTTMNHLLLGLYAEPVRTEPYIPTFFRCDDLRAGELGLGIHPEARLMLAPNIGSYVGGDITAGVFASMLWRREALSLMIDLGTNGELVLGNGEFMLACACSAGPAFEGGDISCGMRATDGAIDALTIDPDTLEPRYTTIGGVPAVGLCGSGLIDAIAALYRAQLIDGRGRFLREGGRVRRDENGMGRYIIAYKEETGSGRDIAVNEVDIDNFIRAKGAIFSAAMTMLNAAGLAPGDLENVYVAGGIGSGINMDNAVAIGMLPDIDRERFQYIGNAALTGAWAMLASRPCREKVEALAASMTYLELSTEPGYMDAFVAACFLPHTDAGLFPSAQRKD